MNSEEKDYIELFGYFSQLLVKYCMKLKHSMIRIQRMPVSFDQILNSRRFNAVIYKEENVYGDRTIEEYMKIMLKINF
jgi:hypothetical protein